MDAREIIEKSGEYFMLTNSNFVLENRDSRVYALGEIFTPEESKYLVKVRLYQMTLSNREGMLQLENILIDNKIPFQHQKN